MSSADDQATQSRTPAAQNPPRAFNCNPWLFWAPAISALILALTLQIANPPLLASLPLKPATLLRLLSPPQRPPAPSPCVLWMAPFLSGGGYSSEAWSYITAIENTTQNPPITLQIDHHGDQESAEFWYGLPDESRLLGYKLHASQCPIADAIVVCHSEPGAWFPPMYQTPPCPPTGYREPLFVVGRTMFETDRLTPEHVQRCNRMDAIWVPSEFHVQTFIQSGVDPSKVVKMVQPVDVDFFDPAKQKPMEFPEKAPALGSRRRSASSFVFLSVFKWEQRKGWDVLLRSYLEEFDDSDGVALYLLVSAYHSDAAFGRRIAEFVEQSGLKEPAAGWATVHLIDTHVAQIDLPGVYKAADAFVLPTRGEGWGRPIVEAMAMALPVIATNWSGPTEYLTEENGFPLPVARMSEVAEGPFKGHLWAEPSKDGLRGLMRYVANNREEGRRKGRRAREDMVRRFAPDVVARLVVDEVLKIANSHSRRRVT